MPEKDGKNDKNLESPEWKLNLSQMQQASGPRVHWAISPLSKSSNALQEADENEDGGNRQDSLKERDLKFGIGLQTRAERLLDLGGSKERKSVCHFNNVRRLYYFFIEITEIADWVVEIQIYFLFSFGLAVLQSASRLCLPHFTSWIVCDHE